MSLRKIIKSKFFGKVMFQSIFRRLFDIAIEGMNIGVGGRNIRESGEEYIIKNLLSKEINPVIFDVGAQGGEYVDSILHNNNKASIYAFEPCLRDFQTLEKHFVNQRIKLLNIAFGEKIGTETLYFPQNVSGLSSFFKDSSEKGLSEIVKMDTIDNFCRSNNIKYVTLLKLDTEGYELSCLKGSREMLQKIKYVQFEMSLGSRNARAYFKDIFDLLKDYKIYRILRDGLTEIKYPDKLSELLFTTNYFAIRKSSEI